MSKDNIKTINNIKKGGDLHGKTTIYKRGGTRII